MKKSAFTLIELSIVLVIIGLIVGGVLVGQDLIKAAQMRTITKDKEKFLLAQAAYKLKYNAIAGDHASAESFFGNTTNNGNGDKTIECHVPGFGDECFTYWQQLALAGLIEGEYNGVNGVLASNDAEIGINIPAVDFRPAAGYHLNYIASQTNSWGESAQTHFFLIGYDNTPNGFAATAGGIFSVDEVRLLDIKVDDGLAREGKLRTIRGTVSYDTDGCTTGGATSFVYNAAGTSAKCNIILVNDLN